MSTESKKTDQVNQPALDASGPEREGERMAKLTERQIAFARAIGRILAEQWINEQEFRTVKKPTNNDQSN